MHSYYIKTQALKRKSFEGLLLSLFGSESPLPVAESRNRDSYIYQRPQVNDDRAPSNAKNDTKCRFHCHSPFLQVSYYKSPWTAKAILRISTNSFSTIISFILPQKARNINSSKLRTFINLTFV